MHWLCTGKGVKVDVCFCYVQVEGEEVVDVCTFCVQVEV